MGSTASKGSGAGHGTGTVEPVLSLLQNCEDVPYIHRNVATEDALKFYARKWVRLSSMPIGYFVRHGDSGQLWFGDESLTLDEFAKILGGKCDNKVIFFASCSTMATGDNALKLCRDTNARGVVGYTKAVDFVEAAAFEVLLLRDLLTTTNIKSAHTRMEREHPYLSKRLGLRMAHKTWASPRSVAQRALETD